MKKSNLSMPMVDEDFGIICLCAVRYAIGRQSYIPRLVVDFLQRNIDYITKKDSDLIVREITEAEERSNNALGDKRIDAPMWLSFRDWLLNIDKLRQSEHQIS